jgi:hypothetical protein
VIAGLVTKPIRLIQHDDVLFGAPFIMTYKDDPAGVIDDFEASVTPTHTVWI